MKQWIIDRYNAGQSKWQITRLQQDCIEVYEDDRESSYILTLYDFLFNPKWGFAKAFWRDNELCSSCGGDTAIDNGSCSLCECDYWIKSYQYHIQQMVISPDPLEYLEKFEEQSDE